MNIPKFSELWLSVCTHTVRISINPRTNFSCHSSCSCLVFPYEVLWYLFYILYGFLKDMLHFMSHFIKLSEPVLGSLTEATATKWPHVIPSSYSFSSFTTLTHGFPE